MVDTLQLHAGIASRAEDFLRLLFGERTRQAGANQWRIGSHGSLSVELQNERLVFFDHESGVGGDAVALWQRECGGSNGDALRACAAWCGLASTAGVSASATPISKGGVKSESRVIPTMPESTAKVWQEGRDWLSTGRDAFRADAVADLAAWRGWPVDYVRTLIRAGLLTAPLIFGQRARAAFPVFEPVRWAEHPNRDRARFVGVHARLRDDEKGGWRFMPHAEKKPGGHPGLPPLPLVLGGAGFGGQLWNTRLLIVCEGQWDALTIPLAAGWFDTALGLLRIPPAVAVVGIVGAGGGSRALLDYFAPFWPASVDVLVLRDGDKAGDKWTEPGCFLDALRGRCGRVESFHFGKSGDGKKRDVGDVWREGKFTRPLLDALLSRVGWKLNQAESAPPKNNEPPPR